MTKEAEAIIEVAKTTSKALELTDKTGGFLRNIFGSLVEDAVGLCADRLKFYRLEKYWLLVEKTEKNLKEKGICVTKEVSPKFAIPLFENATIEDNDYLHTKWANLLSNSLNPNYEGKIEKWFVSVLADITPLDALVFEVVIQKYFEQQEAGIFLVRRHEIINRIHGFCELDIEVSLRNLFRLGCLKSGLPSRSAVEMRMINEKQLSSVRDTECVEMTVFGLEFYKAINLE